MEECNRARLTLTDCDDARTSERVRSIFTWLRGFLAPILQTMTAADSWALEEGQRYRARLIVSRPAKEMGTDGGRIEIQRAFESAGFIKVSVYLAASELPADWASAGVGTAHAPDWNAWVEATWSQPTGEISNGFIDFRIARSDAITPGVTPPAAASSDAPVSKTTARTRPDVRFTGDHSWGFYEGLRDLGARHGWKPIGILSVMQSEAGMRADPNHNNQARGLIQFMPETLRDLGWTGTPDEFAASHDAEAQLPFVERYYAAKTGMPANPDASAFYLANLAPALLSRGGSPDNVIAEESDPRFGFIVTDNPIFAEGTAPNRTIFYRGFQKRFTGVLQGSRWLEAVQRLRFVEDEAGPSLLVKAAEAAGIVAGAALVLGAAWLAFEHFTARS